MPDHFGGAAEHIALAGLQDTDHAKYVVKKPATAWKLKEVTMATLLGNGSI